MQGVRGSHATPGEFRRTQNWIYFLDGVTAQSIDALSRVERINSTIGDWQNRLGTSASGTPGAIVRSLGVNPYVTTKRIAENLGIAFTTAQRALGKLEALGIVAQVSEGRRGRVYCAKRILDILEEPAKVGDNFSLEV